MLNNLSVENQTDFFFKNSHSCSKSPRDELKSFGFFSPEKTATRKGDTPPNIHKTGRNCIFEDLNTGIRSVLTIKLIWSLSSLTALRTLVILFSLDICSFPHTFLQRLHFLVFLTNLFSLLVVLPTLYFFKTASNWLNTTLDIIVNRPWSKLFF